jgi:hypothetical protein
MLTLFCFAGDRGSRPRCASKSSFQLGATQSFSRKITRTCVPLMAVHNWDAAAMQLLFAPIVQTMVAVHNIAGIERYDEYDELRENHRVAQKLLLQGFQETNSRGAKAFCDRAREQINVIPPFFVFLALRGKKSAVSSRPSSRHGRVPVTAASPALQPPLVCVISALRPRLSPRPLLSIIQNLQYRTCNFDIEVIDIVNIVN